ncbi:MAG: transcriptional regulator [Roseobacter sp. MedPE-SWchi]|nr:MAG: transcriptional regulator [Roseobacter sp. MedPE-SWchi]
MSRTHRLFHLMQLLRRGAGPKTAAQLGQDLGVSGRSIHRDIATLRQLGAVIDGEAGYGFTLIEDNALPPLGFRDLELEALVLGLREVEQIGDPDLAEAAAEALRKLQGRLPERQSHRLRHAVLSAHRFERPPLPGITLSDLRQATWDEVEIGFAYTDFKGTQTQRRVRPLGLIYLDRSNVLIAWCLMRRDFRIFRLDRMAALQLTETSFRPRRIPMLRDALAQIDRSNSANTS